MTNDASSNAIRGQIDEIRQEPHMMAFERWRQIGEIIVRDLRQHGHFFNTEQGLFFFDNKTLRAFLLHRDEVGLTSLLNQRYGINAKEYCFQRVLADLICEADVNGRMMEIRRLSHYDHETKLLYVSRFDGCVYRLDGESVVKVQNGTDDVFFFDDRISWTPYDYIRNVATGAFDAQLIDSVNFADSILSKPEQRKLLKLWALAVFFGSIQPTKIILLMLGEHGSGKTSALRRIQKFIFGRKVDLLSIEKDKQDAFVATVTTDPLALFDNVDERISWLPYSLSRLATGVTFPRRVLYTTNTQVEFPGVSWLGITSRTVDFMANQPDLPDRTLVLSVERLIEKVPEGELLSAIEKNRNVMWSELLDMLNAIVGQLRQPAEPSRVQFRMADFASFALRVATSWGCRKEVAAIFTKLEQAQADLVFEDEPIHQVLDLWLVNSDNHGRGVDAATLHRELGTIARANQIEWPFSNGKSLGHRLGHLLHALRQRFDVKVAKDRHIKKNRYHFWPKGLAEAGAKPDRLARLAPPTEPEQTAGIAG
ncbi:MAG: hypothetical protein WB949_10765 [Candidatus Acidiferrales bacterium]